MSYLDYVPFSSLLGATIREITGLEQGSAEVVFVTDAGRFRMYHEQDCCESVSVTDVIGDVADLIGSPVTLAEESTSAADPPEFKREYPPESLTWTFYHLATQKGHVDIRWLGESNGYYSESVYFEKVTQ